MGFGGRAKPSKNLLDENSGRNLSSFIIRYRYITSTMGLLRLASPPGIIVQKFFQGQDMV
jgi:hypothetical protein